MLIVVAKQQAVERRGCNRAHGSKCGEDQCDDIHRLLEPPDVSKARVERDNQEERKEHLHARYDHSQLACELLEVPIETLERCLVADLAAFALLSVLHGFQVTHIPLRGAPRFRESVTIPISVAVRPPRHSSRATQPLLRSYP